MAGIYERIKPSAEDRVSSHLLDAAFVFIHSGNFTNQQVANAIDNTIGSPLTNEEKTDLSNISTQLVNAGNLTNKLLYLEKIKAAFMLVEMGVINETTFRSLLGIV